jgi:hypothetical protein
MNCLWRSGSQAHRGVQYGREYLKGPEADDRAALWRPLHGAAGRSALHESGGRRCFRRPRTGGVCDSCCLPFFAGVQCPLTWRLLSTRIVVKRADFARACPTPSPAARRSVSSAGRLSADVVSRAHAPSTSSFPDLGADHFLDSVSALRRRCLRPKGGAQRSEPAALAAKQPG